MFVMAAEVVPQSHYGGRIKTKHSEMSGYVLCNVNNVSEERVLSLVAKD